MTIENITITARNYNTGNMETVKLSCELGKSDLSATSIWIGDKLMSNGFIGLEGVAHALEAAGYDSDDVEKYGRNGFIDGHGLFRAY